MALPRIRTTKFLFLSLFTFYFITAKSQAPVDASKFARLEGLENNIRWKDSLRETQKELEVIRQQAARSGDDVVFARCLYDLMELRDLRTEDSLYFRNSAFIDSLLERPTTTPTLKAILYVMRAQRLSRFDNKAQRFNSRVYHTRNLKTNYASLRPDQRDSIVTSDLKNALIYSFHKNVTNGLLWLSSNSSVLLFEPELQDIILSEHANLLAGKTHFSYQKKKEMANWLLLSTSEFNKKLDSLSTSENEKNILTGYYHWMEFNKANGNTAAYIESLVRKYIYLFVPEQPQIRQAYTDYLLHAAESSYAPLKAHAVYQLCLIWNKMGNGYADFDYNYREKRPVFHVQYQYYPDKALQLAEKHKELLTAYPLFMKVLDQMVKQIKSGGILIKMEDKQLPQEPIALKAIYKNTDTLFYRIIRVGLKEPREKDSARIQRLVNSQAVAHGKFHLPLPADYNKHAVHLKLDPLPPGQYRLLFSDKAIKADEDDLHHLAFEVTEIVPVYSDEKIFILSRKTGFPLTGAQIKAFKKKTPVKAPSTINDQGYVKISQELADSIYIVCKNDTTGYHCHIRKPALDKHYIYGYDKEDYDDINEFYDDNMEMEIFTDRSIYRPGQTVHFKIIFFTSNPKTGERMIFNRQNLGGLFTNRVKKWLDQKENLLELTDAFDETIDTMRFTINEFGSFAGSFVLPKSAATGSWNIDGYAETDYPNEGAFRVEEYKRPSIEMMLEKQKKMLLPGEAFNMKLKLNSLSGANLSSIPVNYTITRRGSIPSAYGNSYNSYRDDVLIEKKEYTNEKGELIISINDTALAKANLGDSIAYEYTYELKAKAVDATGELTELDESLEISSHPVKIYLPVSGQYDRQSLPALNISTTADFEGAVGHTVQVKLYKIIQEEIPQETPGVDQWYYTKAEWNNWFPDKISYSKSEKNRILILDTLINTGAYEKLVLSKEKISAGFYEILVSCKVNNRIIGRSSCNFKVFDSNGKDIPEEDINFLPYNLVRSGNIITWHTSAKKDSYTIYQILYATDGKKKRIRNEYQTVVEKAGMHEWQYRIPADASDQLSITRICVGDNKINVLNRTLYMEKTDSEQPEIIVEKYRKVMAPGEKETFTLSVKTKHEQVVAELMTTLYDASLDKLEEHRWGLPHMRQLSQTLYTHWNSSISSTYDAGKHIEYSQPVNLPGIETDRAGTYYLNSLQGKVSGVNITSASGLKEVMITTGAYRYSALSAKSMSASHVIIRGATSLQDNKQPLIIVDGVPYTGDLKDINSSKITEAIVLKGADASALYGARAAEGVLIISTKGPIKIPTVEEPLVKIRKNFNETAFFFPQVHADQDGYYRLSFTMPETATKWNWKMLAHTRKAQFMYLEKKIQTQLNLMVQPNMPRLLYQGDKLKLQSRVSNLDTTAINGKVRCKIEDVVTGEDITLQLTDGKEQAFHLNKKSSGSVSFLVQVPAQQLNPIKIIITAISAGAADAEEHVIPVLSTRVFTRQSIPLQFDKQQTLTIPSVALPADASVYGMSISIAQNAQASLINSLPWLANYSYDCAEQAFNKLRANVTALRLIKKDTAAQRVLKNAADFVNQNKSKEEQLPDELAEEAMPWMRVGNRTEQQQKQLFRLLDTSVSKASIEKHLERLFSLQRANGGLSWFDGGESSTYISAYVLSGFGQLKQQGWVPAKEITGKYHDFIKRLLKFLETELMASSTSTPDSYKLYAMSYWPNDLDTTAVLTKKINATLQATMNDLNKRSLEQQAFFIINALRYTSKGEIYRKAHNQLKNLVEQAIYDEQNGIRWKELSDSENLSNSAEETMAIVAEAFEASNNYDEIPSYILKWLLTKHQDERWRTTKAVAAAITILQKKEEGVLEKAKTFSLKREEVNLSVSDGLLTGIPVSFVRLKQVPQSLTVQQQGERARGAFTLYYFAEPSKLDTLNKQLRIQKQLYAHDKDKGWIKYTPDRELKAGDELRVQLTIETSSRLKYVHISDPRVAACEYVDKESGYQYTQGFYYYKSIRDNGLELFAENIPKGIFELSYEMIVEHEGEFASGPARLQCMYDPSVTTYSSTTRIKTK